MTFDIDAHGILNVSAKDQASGKQQQITITASSGLSKQEVERMVKEAEAHASEDARRRQEVEVRNETDALVYSTDRALAEHGAKLSETDRTAVQQAVNEAREALKSDDVERMRRAQDTLTRLSRVLAEAMYRQSKSEASADAPTSSSPPESGEVVDAEFEDTDRKAS